MPNTKHQEDRASKKLLFSSDSISSQNWQSETMVYEREVHRFVFMYNGNTWSHHTHGQVLPWLFSTPLQRCRLAKLQYCSRNCESKENKDRIKQIPVLWPKIKKKKKKTILSSFSFLHVLVRDRLFVLPLLFLPFCQEKKKERKKYSTYYKMTQTHCIMYKLSASIWIFFCPFPTDWDEKGSKGKGTGILFNASGQTGQDCSLTRANGVNSRIVGEVYPPKKKKKKNGPCA